MVFWIQNQTRSTLSAIFPVPKYLLSFQGHSSPLPRLSFSNDLIEDTTAEYRVTSASSSSR